MENHIQESKLSLPLAIVIAGVVVAGAVLYKDRGGANQAELKNNQITEAKSQMSALEESVIPTEGVILPITWGDLGAKLSSVGVIDAEKFMAVYGGKDKLTDEEKNLLFGESNGKIKITKENAGYLLNLFWALGLGSKNPILDSGEMVDQRYGGAQNFASTAGWTIAAGNSMVHYSKHKFFNLTSGQQGLVDKVSRGIYRPCCGNSTHFPDCNHGMAMLGLLELMASQGASEQEMWQTTLAVNSYWFPDTYLTIATYMKNKGVEWQNVNPQEMLGINYSSAQGYAKIAAQVIQTQPRQSSGGCDVGAGESVSFPKQQSGCGV